LENLTDKLEKANAFIEILLANEESRLKSEIGRVLANRLKLSYDRGYKDGSTNIKSVIDTHDIIAHTTNAITDEIDKSHIVNIMKHYLHDMEGHVIKDDNLYDNILHIRIPEFNYKFLINNKTGY